MLQRFISLNIRVANWLDSFLPMSLRRDGNKWFHYHFLEEAVVGVKRVFEIGGGSRPYLSPDMKARLGVTVVGLDIDEAELLAAPAGAYDQIVVGDLCTYEGDYSADTVICQAVLEHVPNTAGAMRAIATTLKPGGRAYIFAPSRFALFAILNRMLPQELKKRLLFAIFPEKATGHEGFRAYYDKCFPTSVEKLAIANGLTVEKSQIFWVSSYFKSFLPAYFVWRIYQAVSYVLLGRNAAESFAYILRKPA